MAILTISQINDILIEHRRAEEARNAPAAVARRCVYELASVLADLDDDERVEILMLIDDEIFAPRRARDDEPEPAPRAAWEIYRDQWLAKGYNIHAYHGFKDGPVAGCNAMYGPDNQCSASIDQHCHCGNGDHRPLNVAETAR